MFRCPECSTPFDLVDPSTFTRHAPRRPLKLWMPGVILASAYTLLTIPVIVGGMNAWGWSLWLALPAAAGALAGYRYPISKFALPLVVVLIMLSFVGGIVTMGLGGVFCSLILCGILMVPVFMGVVSGFILRLAMKTGDFDQAPYLPLLVIASIPYICVPLEKWTTPVPSTETVSTSMIIDAPADECWEGLVFYEEVSHPPPWILRVGLARPVATRGTSLSPGERRVCVYNKGTITKQVRRAEPGRHLSFDVIDQDIGYERDLRLISGSFTFEPIDDARTRVTLTSTYEPRLSPRFCWRWGEKIAFRTLHNYVLEGIAINASAERTDAAPHAAVIARDAP